ncbi:gasdermin-E [Silurus meridionalis]|uniref:Gasdermin pore forming domain-containing protein n=1 Tax=Silurus meridionalis TaxID=175797 RepID=A0A8T0A3C3_SILME|nr:gasdermin-E [Silurus meridionalis]KAF7686222.1 hypothetical protein HF521_015584 [Silurus meridionalis]
MFEKVTHSLLHRTDQDGTLIAVSRLNDSEKLKPLAVVIKCPRTWFWQRSKYKPTDFTLNDLLQGKPIEPVIEKKVFLNKYEETQKGSVTGSGEIDMTGVSMEAKGHGKANILSSLGTLHKESVIMRHFLKDSKDRKVDLEHNLIKHIQGKNQFFTLVKERIFTTCDSTINFSELREGSCTAILQFICPAKVRLYQSICLQNTRDVAIAIPPHTVVAYSVFKISIKSDGDYEVDVSPDGIKKDCITTQCSTEEVDGLQPQTQITEESSLSALGKELTNLKATLCELAHLPTKTRVTLLNLFQEILPDPTLLSTLEDKLKKICDESLSDSHPYLPDTSNELIDRFLDSLQSDTDNRNRVFKPNGLLQTISNQKGSQSAAANWTADNTSHNASPVKPTSRRQLILIAMHMLISAAEELTSNDLAWLMKCSSNTINGLHYLVTRLTNASRVPFCELNFLLGDGEVAQEVELLFNSSNITLKKDNKELYAEIESGNTVLPFVLCIVIHGLAYLNDSCEIDIEI